MGVGECALVGVLRRVFFRSSLSLCLRNIEGIHKRERERENTHETHETYSSG